MTFRGLPPPAQLEAVAGDYASVLGFPIQLHCPRHGYSRRRPGSQLHVHLHALPLPPLWVALWSEGSTGRLPMMALGHRLVDGRGRSYAPPGRLAQGVTLTDGDGGAVLHLSSNNLYVLFDLLGQPEPLGRLLLRKSLDLALPRLETWIVSGTGLPAARVPVLLNRLRRDTVSQEVGFRQSARTRAGMAYVEQQRRGLREETAFLVEEIRTAAMAVEELSCRMTQEARHLAACRQRLRVLQEGVAEVDRAADDLARLGTLEGVREVEAHAGGIRLVTTPIEVVHGGVRYRLGCFQLDLAETGAIRIRNLTDPFGLYDHPHVWNGLPCLGNVREGLAKLLAEYQWVAAAEVLLDFLRTVTPRDWYLPVTHWKAVPA
jgi:hypothetical protein